MTTEAQPTCADSQIGALDEWHEKRKTGIGGSDAAAVLGVDPWCSAFELYSRKVGLIGPRETSEAAEWGHRHEPTIREWYREETGRGVFDLEFYETEGDPSRELVGDRVVLRSRAHPFMLANLDALIYDERKGSGVLEIKTSTWPEPWADGPPPWCVAQMQHYLAVTGLAWGAFAVLFKGNRGGHVDVERDDAYIANLIEAEREFWRRVQECDPPEPDTTESSDRTLREIYSTTNGETIELPDRADGLIREITAATATVKAAKEYRRACETRLRDFMGAAALGITPDGGTVKRIDVRGTDTREPYSYLKTAPRE